MDDWQIGDLALCVTVDGFFGDPLVVVRKGAIYEVNAIGFNDETGSKTLNFKGIAPETRAGAYGAWRFRKIRPLSDAERGSFLADLREPSHDLITAALVVAPAVTAPNVRDGHFAELIDTHFHAAEVSDR